MTYNSAPTPRPDHSAAPGHGAAAAPSPAEPAPEAAARLQRYEERVAWLERHVGEQDRAMLEMAHRIDALVKATTSLRTRLGEDRGGADGGPEAPEPPPPHY